MATVAQITSLVGEAESQLIEMRRTVEALRRLLATDAGSAPIAGILPPATRDHWGTLNVNAKTLVGPLAALITDLDGALAGRWANMSE